MARPPLVAGGSAVHHDSPLPKTGACSEQRCDLHGPNRRGGSMFKHILMPTDGSDHSERAVERGIELAKLCGAEITGIHVVQDYRLISATDGWMGDAVLDEKVQDEARERAARFLSFVQKTADAAGV